MDGHHSVLSSSVPRSWSCYCAPCAASWSGRNGSANEGPMIHLWGRNSHAKVPTSSITSSNLHRKYSTLFNMFSGIKLLTATSFHSFFPSFHSTALQKLQCGNWEWSNSIPWLIFSINISISAVLFLWHLFWIDRPVKHQGTAREANHAMRPSLKCHRWRALRLGESMKECD